MGDSLNPDPNKIYSVKNDAQDFFITICKKGISSVSVVREIIVHFGMNKNKTHIPYSHFCGYPGPI